LLTIGWAVLAVVQGEVVGGVFYNREPDHLYLGRLAVLPAYRRYGIGQALTAYVESRARALGVPRVQLSVRLALLHLQAYYERLGYRVVHYATHQGYTAPTSAVLEKQVGGCPGAQP
jgi:ribosomal protein S18 acetylase RimI-like enzyme